MSGVTQAVIKLVDVAGLVPEILDDGTIYINVPFRK